MLDKIRKYFHSSWWKLLLPYLQTEEGMKPILRYSEAAKAKEYLRPGAKDLFNVYSNEFDKIKVVIVGQDPYNTGNHAHGYSFSTKYSPPYSLQIILKEIYRSHFQDKKIGGMNEVFCCGDLRQWADQGVFLLNRYLSVGKEPESHADWGWQYLTDATIKLISEHSLKPVVFMLWGAKAKELKPLIDGRHHIVEAHHPASERYGKSFIGNNVFVECDRILSSYRYMPINWGIWPQYVESFTISFDSETTFVLPYYFKKYFYESFGKEWQTELTVSHAKSLELLDKALGDIKFKRFAWNSSCLTMDQENYHKLLFLGRIIMRKHDNNQIKINEV